MNESIFDIFREEAREHLTALEKGFLDLEAATPELRKGVIDSLFRHAHSLKGDAKAVGIVPLKGAAQLLEDLLDELRNSPDHTTPQRVNQGLAHLDLVRNAFESWGKEAGVSRPSTDGMSWPPTSNETTLLEPHSSPVVRVPNRVPPATSAAEQVPESAATDRQSVIVTRPSASEESFTVRVSSDRLDRMLNLAGEVRIAQRAMEIVHTRLAGLADQLETTVRESSGSSSSELVPAFQSVMEHVRRIASDFHKRQVSESLLMENLQSSIRQARLLPLLMLTDSLRRVVRDLSQSLGKRIRYEVDVGQILLDKAVIEALKDPLHHLVRNAADHGLETSQERRVAGKADEGLIHIQARQHGPTVRIAIADDGRGLDYERIRARVCHQGKISESEVARLTDRDLIPFLFQPGFTTARTGEISGRGVGLDVVADSVHRLQGRVEIERSSPAGTTFVITVPVSISTIRVLTVIAGGQTFGIPSSIVIRAGRAVHSDLRELHGKLVLNLNGAPLPWIHLSELVGNLGSHPAAPGESWPYLVIARPAGSMVVAVEEIADESEVLLKPLGYPLKGTPGILGGTIRADGSVQLLLDLASAAMTSGGSRAAVPWADTKPVRRIMVVDDSPTTRGIMRNVFTAAGYAVVTATDGIDALEQLRSQKVHLVVTDVEMPRLNGFDLTRQIKAKSSLPVILVTGREKEEHRREGLDAGADAYVIKSTFAGDGLLEIVEQWL